MNGNFDERQNLKDNDQTVDARGWLTWDPDDKSAEITITVSQNGTECPAPPITCTPSDSTWRVPVTRAAPPPWSKGAASGTATAKVTRQDGSTYDVPWNSPPLTLG
jgi:hypothetical protein